MIREWDIPAKGRMIRERTGMLCFIFK